jgi:hypothetical protein
LVGEFAAEGFVDAVTPDLATANTALIPRITNEDAPPRRPRGGVRRRVPWFPLAALGLLAALLITGVVVALNNNGPGGTASHSGPATPSLTAGGVSFSPEGAVRALDCAGHAYGDVRVWLGQHPCTDVVRSVFQTTSDGQPAAVSLAVVTFHDPATAKAFGDVANSPGSGGITDLVKDGARWTGGPTSFDNAAYTVAVHDNSVRLTEVVWVDRASTPTDPALTKLASAAAGLPASS